MHTLAMRSGMAASAASAFPAGSSMPALDQPSDDTPDPCSHLSEVPDLADLEVHYQPIVGVPCGQPLAVEAHVRWRHPRIGVVPPCVFAGEAERTGALTEIVELTIRRALADLARVRWLLDLPDLRLSLSLSAADLERPGVVEHLAACLAEHDYAPGSVIVAIPEQAAIDPERVSGVIDRLRALGVAIAVDELSSRHAAHVVIDRLPIDMVKISRQYVAEMADSMIARAMVRSIVRLGQRHHVAVIATGVESPEVAAAVAELGVRAAQGHVFGRPTPMDRLSRLQWDEPVADGDRPGGPGQEKPTADATAAL